jgi:hypothetical protein
VDTSLLTARRVGVRGKSRYNERLHARLLEARDIEPLEAER